MCLEFLHTIINKIHKALKYTLIMSSVPGFLYQTTYLCELGRKSLNYESVFIYILIVHVTGFPSFTKRLPIRQSNIGNSLHIGLDANSERPELSKEVTSRAFSRGNGEFMAPSLKTRNASILYICEADRFTISFDLA